MSILDEGWFVVTGTYAYVGCPDGSRVVLGSGRLPGEGWPLFDVLADVELGAGVGAGP